MPQLDEFLLEQESHLDGRSITPDVQNTLQEVGGGGSGEKGGDDPKRATNMVRGKLKTDQEEATTKIDKEESSVTNVDEDYVHALEIYCLLKQRLLDVRRNWKMVLKEVLADYGKHAGENSTIPL